MPNYVYIYDYILFIYLFIHSFILSFVHSRFSVYSAADLVAKYQT